MSDRSKQHRKVHVRTRDLMKVLHRLKAAGLPLSPRIRQFMEDAEFRREIKGKYTCHQLLMMVAAFAAPYPIGANSRGRQQLAG